MLSAERKVPAMLLQAAGGALSDDVNEKQTRVLQMQLATVQAARRFGGKSV